MSFFLLQAPWLWSGMNKFIKHTFQPDFYMSQHNGLLPVIKFASLNFFILSIKITSEDSIHHCWSFLASTRSNFICLQIPTLSLVHVDLFWRQPSKVETSDFRWLSYKDKIALKRLRWQSENFAGNTILVVSQLSYPCMKSAENSWKSAVSTTRWCLDW